MNWVFVSGSFEIRLLVWAEEEDEGEDRWSFRWSISRVTVYKEKIGRKKSVRAVLQKMG